MSLVLSHSIYSHSAEVDRHFLCDFPTYTEVKSAGLIAVITGGGSSKLLELSLRFISSTTIITLTAFRGDTKLSIPGDLVQIGSGPRWPPLC